MSFISSLRASASALTAQRLRMDVISSNIANLHTTRGVDGEPYKRRTTVLGVSRVPNADTLALSGRTARPDGVRVVRIEEREGVRQTYDPKHPDADEAGFVSYPDIDIVEEMTDMMSAVRAYEASVAALNAVKGMALKALEIGRG